MRSVSDHEEFGKWIVAEMMKVQTLFEADGLQIRLERVPNFDGYKIGAKLPGKEPLWQKIAYLPGQMQYSMIEGAIAEIRAYVTVGQSGELIPEAL